jgi:DNA helicase II / ATP-dependent DNA helicase PcrA
VRAVGGHGVDDVAIGVLGRGVIVPAGVDPGPRWAQAERLVVDDAVLAEPGPAVLVAHDAWRTRRPLVVELACDRAALREPQVLDLEPYRLEPSASLGRDDLYQLIRATCYEWRDDGPRWGPALEAKRLGAELGGPADVVLADGRPAWCDGGPWDSPPVAEAIVHRDVLALGRLVAVGDRPRTRPGSLSLDPEQEAAATEPRGAVRVIAPAGSGKTRTLAARLAHLLGERGVDPAIVTAVAYNKRAERELSARVDGLGAQVRTIHSLALRVLQLAGPVTVLDERETRRVAQEVVDRAVKLTPRPDRDVLAPYLEALDEVRAALRAPEVIEARRDDVDGLAVVFPAYRERLARMGAVDFAEMVYAAIALLLTDPGVRAAARCSCRHLLVDEYQDLTPAYLLLLRLLAAPTAQVFGVGDDDQTIYGHAGADPRFLVDFGRYVPGAAEHALTRSYRCPTDVVAGVGRLLERNLVRVPKDVEATSGRDGGLRIERRPTSELAERGAAVVAGWLDAGAPPTEVCVLARVNAALLPVQVALARAGVPVASTIGPDVLRRTGTATALAWLRLAVDTGRMSGDDLTAATRRPSRGINRLSAAIFRRRSTWSMSDLRGVLRTLDGRDLERWTALIADIEGIARVAAAGDTAAVLAHLADVIGLGSALELLDGSRSSADRSTHVDDLHALVQVGALEPDPAAFEASLRGWLGAAARPGRLSDDDGAPEADGRVTLSSVHRVKGLEWDHVLVVGADAGLVPHRLAEGRDGVEEERRVLHVALTRCRVEAVALADSGRPSPFLGELDGSAPAGHLDALMAATPSAASVRPAARKVAALVPSGPEPEGTEEIFTALRAWRTQQAKADGHPAYVVLKDVDLRSIAALRPRTPIELSRCPGIGPTKLDRFGEAILEVIERAVEG